MDFTLKSEIVVTGEIPGYKRSQIAEIISYSGGRLAPVVTYSTNYLVVGLKPGKTKLDKAIRIGTFQPPHRGRAITALKISTLYGALAACFNPLIGEGP
jgi:hypothetical protein